MRQCKHFELNILYLLQQTIHPNFEVLEANMLFKLLQKGCNKYLTEYITCVVSCEIKGESKKGFANS